MGPEGTAPPEGRRGFSRGGLLKAGAGAAAAAAVSSGPLAQVASGAARDPLGYLYLKTYEPLVGSTFTVQATHGPVPAKLVEAQSYSARGPRERARREAFHLLFQANTREPMPQGTYQVEHPTLGGFSLFLVPVGRGQKVQELEAVVNRWLDARHP